MNFKSIFIAGAVSAAALASPAAIRSVTPQVPTANWVSSWWMNRHNEKMSVVTNGGAKVVFIGDSITHFWDSTGKEQQSRYYGEGDMKMLGLGMSADRTEHVLWRLTEGRELDGYEAKAVFLMIGTNNSGHFKFSEEPPIDTILGIREILRVIAKKQPKAKIILTAIFPRGRGADDGYRRRNGVVNGEIRKFADGRHVLWLDMNDDFLMEDGTLSCDVFPDLLHPGAYGYELWAAATLPYAQAAVAGLPMPPSRFARPRRGVFRDTEPLALFPASRISGAGFAANDWWLDRMLSKRNEIAAAKGEIDLVFFGDSITHNWERKVPEIEAELRKTYTLLNLGYSGDRTENLLWRGENGELDGYRAKCVMLLIGTNNTWHRNDKPEDIASGVKKILELIARKQPTAKTLLLPIFPFGAGPTDAKRVNNEKANALIGKFADGKDVILVDFNEKFLDAKGDNVKWMPDHCHPNPAGYREIWLPAVLPHFKAICGK